MSDFHTSIMYWHFCIEKSHLPTFGHLLDINKHNLVYLIYDSKMDALWLNDWSKQLNSYYEVQQWIEEDKISFTMLHMRGEALLL